MPEVFAVPVFFICFRETLECSIIISILLAWLKSTIDPAQDPVTYKKLRKQIWLGTLIGLLICLAIGGGMIGAFYSIGVDHWANTENLWEGIFSLIASIIITVVGAAMLRVSKLQEKWQAKLKKALEDKKGVRVGSKRQRFKQWCERYAMFLLPFITVLREGLEAVVFIGGVGLAVPATSIPLAVLCGLAAGALIGFFIYKGGRFVAIQIFLIASTCVLYLIAAGLFSKAVWNFEANKWNAIIGSDADDVGSGAGSYDIRQSVWHVNCCNPETDGGGGWGIFNAILGWQNSATYGSVISYNLYWIAVMAWFICMRYKERRGHWPLMKWKADEDNESSVECAADLEKHSGSESDLEAGKNNVIETIHEA